MLQRWLIWFMYIYDAHYMPPFKSILHQRLHFLLSVSFLSFEVYLKHLSFFCVFLCVHTHILITLGCDKYQFATLVSCHFHSKRKDTQHNLVEWEDGRVPITIYHIRFDINLRTTAVFGYKHWYSIRDNPLQGKVVAFLYSHLSHSSFTDREQVRLW